MRLITLLFVIALSGLHSWGQSSPDQVDKTSMQRPQPAEWHANRYIESPLKGLLYTDRLLDKTDNVVFYEPFNVSGGQLPEAWQQMGAPHNWVISNTSQAGGQAPELLLVWTPVANGISRIVSPPIVITGYEGLGVKFRQYLDLWQTNEHDALGLDVSFDGGNSWQVVWEQILVQNIYPVYQSANIIIPADAQNMQLAFRFEGNSENINYWYLDDLLVEELPENDLAALTLEGNLLPTAGTENSYTIRVKNLGLSPQNNYSVKLINEQGLELASMGGLPIESGEEITHMLSWTPGPADIGPMSLSGVVLLNDDENMANNQTSVFNVVIQNEGIVTVSVGDGNLLQQLPYNFFWEHSISQTMYYQEEMGINGGIITAIQYIYQFNEAVSGKEVKIWIGETEMTGLSESWIDPGNLQLVFDGLVDFQAGQHALIIPFDNPYAYIGGNLIVYSQRLDNQWSVGKAFFNTFDPNNVRSRMAQRDYVPFDPANPGVPGTALSYFPNTTFFMTTDGTGSISGVVQTDNQPLQGVSVTINGTSISGISNAQGQFSFPVIISGTYALQFSKFGFINQTLENIEVSTDQTTNLEVNLLSKPSFAVSGVLNGNDGTQINEAIIRLSGYDLYNVQSDPEGNFSIPAVFEGVYELTITAPGYNTFTNNNLSVSSDTTLEITLDQTVFQPGGLEVLLIDDNPGNALFTWNAGLDKVFRHDSGTPQGSLVAYTNNYNSVLGSVHRNIAELYTISWMPPDEEQIEQSGDVKIWVFGLNEDGQPDRQQVLYSQDGIVAIPGEWNEYTFSTPVQAPNGFLIGISSGSPYGLTIDFGQDPDWPFVNQTQFFSLDIDYDDFVPLEVYGYQWNPFIRANGRDFGNIGYNALANALSTASGFEVFLNDMNNPVAYVDEFEYLFTNLDEGSYTAGVRALYASGPSEMASLDFVMSFPVQLIINLTTNSGESVAGAQLSMTNATNQNIIYTAIADETGSVHFNQVRKGTYKLVINLEAYQTYTDEALTIDQDLQLNIELQESTEAPYNLMVLTQGLDAGQALFSWNNPTQGWTENFENGSLPSEWSQIITNNGTNMGRQTSWHITGAVGNIVPVNGDYQAYMMWDFNHQDEWLISPEFVAPAGNLSFWYHGTTGSTFGDNYYVKITTDGGSSWEVLWNASDLPFAYNPYQEPAVIDLSLYAGQSVRLAWRNEDGPSDFGMWYMWAIDNITVGDMTIDVKDLQIVSSATQDQSFTKDRGLNGYNVFLNGALIAEGLADAQYLFSDLSNGNYTAGVQAIYSSGTSETAEIEFIVHDNYLLSLVAQPAGSGMLQGAAWYTPGSQVLVNAVAAENYAFINWTDTQGEIISEAASFFYSMPAEDKVLVANFQEFETFSLTFNLDLSQASGLLNDLHSVNITGSMHDWVVLGGDARDQSLKPAESEGLYSITFLLEPGTYSYAYYLNSGEHDNDWEGIPARHIEFDADTVIYDIWSLPTSVLESESEELVIYPNPVADALFIKGADWANQVIITDLMGRYVLNAPFQGNRINTTSLDSGIYFLHLTDNSGRKLVRKLIKQ